jgi:hypothetical protein
VIALVSTFLVAAYVLGPDLFSRWMLGFVVQRRNITQSKSEEITRGVLWAIIPLWMAWMFRHVGPWSLPQNSKIDLQVFFSGLYSDLYFKDHQQEFFDAAGSFIRLNVCVLLRLYLVILLSGILLNFLIKKYGTIRHFLASKTKGSKTLGLLSRNALSILSTVVLPRISEWHVTLSPILLPSKEMNIGVDVLTKSGTLYAGALEDKVIGPDGNLQTITLRDPRRFRREEYLEDKKNSLKPKPENYWKAIPGNLFVIMASDITTLNVRHLPATVGQFRGEYRDISEALNRLRSKVLDLSQKESIAIKQD